MQGSVEGGRTQTVGHADMSTNVSTQLPFLCVFHFFHSVGLLTYFGTRLTLSAGRKLRVAVLFGQGWLR